MNYEAKIILLIIGTIEDLVEKGLMSRGDACPRITESGMEIYKKMVAEGFTFNTGKDALDAFMHVYGERE